MNYYIVYGLVITILGSIITGIGYVKQLKSDKLKDIELKEYRETSLKNQDNILEKSDITYEKTVEIHEDVEDVKDTNKELLAKSEEQFEKINKPVLTIQNLKITKDHQKYVLYIKNSGKSMANDIQLHIDYSTPAGKGVIHKWKELPAGETSILQIDVLHFYNQIQHIEDLKKEYDNYIEAFKNNEKSFVVNLKLEYTWDDNTYTSKDYFIIHSQNELILN